MKHLIEPTNLSGLATVPYDRIVLDSTENDVIIRGGGYEYVDLGLPSGLKWAKCNIGAEKETDFGDYFMWGSVTPNTADECIWANAPFNNGASSYNSTYFKSVKDTVCPNGILAKEYDAAAQIMGGDWRMPTRDNFKELIDNTTKQWVNNFNGSGVGGYKFISKTDTSKYIFFPKSGQRSGSSFKNQNYNCSVWSSSLQSSRFNYALRFFFYSDELNVDKIDDRCNGNVVRGVL